MDQIHLWAATDFRDFAIRHLKPWHEFARKCYANDVDHMRSRSESAKRKRITWTESGQVVGYVPRYSMELPKWAVHATEATRKKLKRSIALYITDNLSDFRGEGKDTGIGISFMTGCYLPGCRNENWDARDDPGYPIESLEDLTTHSREIHGETDEKEIFTVLKEYETYILRRADEEARASESTAAAGGQHSKRGRGAAGDNSCRKRGRMN